MAIFEDYARFYDCIYQSKDYVKEIDFLEDIFTRYAGSPVKTILDLGCGTGGHGFPLAIKNYAITGVDSSQEMLWTAQKKALSLGLTNLTSFHKGDIRSLNLGRTFDTIICMFAVLTYMNTNADILDAFRTARRHLLPGGLFVFDTWSGWAVLSEKPVNTHKVFERDGRRIERFAFPELDMMSHTVRMQYKILEMDNDKIVSQVQEIHKLRFMFPQEITHYLDEAGFHMLRLCPFLRLDDELGEKDWNLAVVAQAK